jgi:RNA polymerase sigma factor (sigma-70 family)
MRLAQKIAWQVAKRLPSIDVADLTSEAVIALHDAVEQFDPSRGVPFSAFAWRRVHQRVLDAVRYRLGWVKDRRWEGRRAVSVVSLDAIVEGAPWFDLPTYEPGFDEVEEAVDGRAALAIVPLLLERLTRRETRVLRLRLEGRSLAEIGADLGVTDSRICQIERHIADVAQRSLGLSDAAVAGRRRRRGRPVAGAA